MHKNRIIPQMFDVRPVDKTGSLDWKKIQLVGANLDNEMQFRNIKVETEKVKKDEQRAILLEVEKKRLEKQQEIVWEKIHKLYKEKEIAIIAQKTERQNRQQELIRKQTIAFQNESKKIADFNRKRNQAYEEAVFIERKKLEQEEARWLEDELRADAIAQAKKNQPINARDRNRKKESLINEKNVGEFCWQDVLFPKSLSFYFDFNKSLKIFAVVAIIVSFSIGTLTYASRGIGVKGKVLGVSNDGYENLNLAINDIAQQNFEGGTEQFNKAFANFSDGSNQLESMGGVLLDIMRFIPFASKVSSGKNAVEAGKHFATAGKALNEVAKVFSDFKNASVSDSQLNVSLLDVLNVAQENITKAKDELTLAQQNIDLISIDDLPQDKRDKFLLIKKQLPDLINALDLFLNNSHLFADLLGGNGPRKYLFLFQNNSEIRPTGGFIGSYGLLDIANGHIKNFFIDGIFNPDGQLIDKIVPPLQIQKISAAWSMHDSNWFADFPMSARKAIQFYEKTGGPTADGVITFTPKIMEKLLKITGPIAMPEYNVIIDSDNFIETTQYKVEVDYDKQENKPKKILSDLASIVLEKLLNSNDLEVISKTMQAFLDGLKEKNILFYFENLELQKIISKQGWSGEIISTPKDYLSVINTNINGFKTDAVMDERISHLAEIQSDGSIIDTVTITRKHNGGNSPYEWLNKVNSNYMRVYVPIGAKLLEVSGQTREINKPVLDYDALGFARDTDVQSQEGSTSIDPKSGTRIYEESGKTVFANWTYTSPQETTVITYKYLLPFSLFKLTIGEKQQTDSYSLVAQKQAGSVGSLLVSDITFPSNYNVKWNFPSENVSNNGELKVETKLNIDRFVGLVFEKK